MLIKQLYLLAVIDIFSSMYRQYTLFINHLIRLKSNRIYCIHFGQFTITNFANINRFIPTQDGIQFKISVERYVAHGAHSTCKT